MRLWLNWRNSSKRKWASRTNALLGRSLPVSEHITASTSC